MDLVLSSLFELLMWPAEWATDHLWKLHRTEPWWRRLLGGTVLIVVSVAIYIAWLAILIGIPIAIYLVATGGG